MMRVPSPTAFASRFRAGTSPGQGFAASPPRSRGRASLREERALAPAHARAGARLKLANAVGRHRLV